MTEAGNSGNLVRELEQLFKSAKLPTSPAVATRILTLIDDPRSSSREFTELIESDPAVAARLLRMANSARYAQRKRCASIQRAITIIGLRQLRITVLGFELVAHLDRLGDCPFDLNRFWRQSVLRACLAREITRRLMPGVAEEAFLVGLLQDCGMLVLVQLFGAHYAELCRANLNPEDFYAAEKKRFPSNHIDAIAALGTIWRLPGHICDPLARHHERVRVGARSSESLKLAAVAHFVGSLVLDEVAENLPDQHDLVEYARTDLKLSSSDLRACFDAAAEAFAPTAELFEGQVEPGAGLGELLMTANRMLMEEACDSENRIREVEAERDQAIGDQVTLRTALGQYREQAARDPLTMILNRRALLDGAETLLEHEGTSVTAMFLDIDNFKTINDQHGHQAGDGVLQRVAQMIDSAAGADGIAGRYGGEEFVAFIPDLDEQAAQARAAELLQSIRGMTFPPEQGLGHITCSLGTYWCPHREAPPADEMVHIADELMYLAKRTGKDRACLRSALAPELVLTVGQGERPDAVVPGVSLGDRFIDGPPCAETFAQIAAALNEQQSERFAELRKRDRTSVGLVCTLRYFPQRTLVMRDEEAYVRSSSPGGVGLLCGRPMARGDVVEVEIDAGADGTVFVAGVVAFARPVTGAVHELGVQLFDRSRKAILSADPAAAMASLDWVAEALRSGAETPGLRKSA